MFKEEHHYSALLGWNSSHSGLSSPRDLPLYRLPPLLPNVSGSDSTSKSFAIDGELSVMHPWQIFRIGRAKNWVIFFSLRISKKGKVLKSFSLWATPPILKADLGIEEETADLVTFLTGSSFLTNYASCGSDLHDNCHHLSPGYFLSKK